VSWDLWFAAAWGLWIVSWVLASLWSSPIVSRPPARWELAYRIPTAIGAALMFFDLGRRHAGAALWPLPDLTQGLLLALALAGFGFAWWARVTLGALWSGSVSRKEEHAVVETGPYALVRHPIYTGLILALLATAFYRAELTSLVGCLIIIVATFGKARLEEGFLRRELGAEAYDGYARRVPMLVPIPWRRTG
jgi:protein-S-isoprenylcysteine O-methyltransferase Ste14